LTLDPRLWGRPRKVQRLWSQKESDDWNSSMQLLQFHAAELNTGASGEPEGEGESKWRFLGGPAVSPWVSESQTAKEEAFSEPSPGNWGQGSGRPGWGILDMSCKLVFCPSAMTWMYWWCWELGLWEVIRVRRGHEGRAPMMAWCFVRRVLPCDTSCMWWCNTRPTCWHHLLHFPASRTVRNRYFK
jgi:hypothetical protein